MAKTHTAQSYEVGDRIHVRAQQIWLILVHCALGKRTITYGDLAVMMGYSKKSARITIKPVAIVAMFCKTYGLPLLNTLVISASLGEPGSQAFLTEGESVAQSQQKVFNFDWVSIRIPTPGALRTLWETWEGE